MQNQKNELRVSAKNLEQALAKGAASLGVPQEELKHRVISKTNGGFFSFLGKKIEIAVWAAPKRSRNNQSDSKRKPRRPVRNEAAPKKQVTRASETQPEMSSQEITALKDDLTTFCAGICSHMFGESVEVKSHIDGDRLVVNIENEYLAAQVAKNGKLAESLEHILRKKPRHLKRELPFRIFVDVQGLRQKRESDLAEMAHDLSEKVSKNKRPIVLNYKSSYDRKIIHMTLDKDDRVYTKSIGSGPNRKLMILPAKRKTDGDFDGHVDESPISIDG